MIRFSLIYAILILLGSTWAEGFPLNQCFYSLGANHQNLLSPVYDKFQGDHQENICPIHFDVKDSDHSFDCTGKDPGAASYSQKPGLAVLAYRNINAELYEVAYQVCLADSAGHPARILGIEPNSWKKLVEVVVRKNLFNRKMTDKPENEDDNCDTNRVIAQQVCADPGYRVYAFELPNVMEQSKQSHLMTVNSNTQNPACVVVSFNLQGAGYKEYPFGVKDCIEHAKYKYSIALHAYTTAQP